MVLAEITIKIEVDESKLTKGQLETADTADINLTVDHPCTKGVNDLTAAIAALSPLSYFNYLKEGREAIEIAFDC